MRREPVTSVADAAARVVRDGNCSGCGLCTLLDPSLSMRLDADGFNRPVPTGGATRTDGTEVRRFERCCPGITVRATGKDGDGGRDPLFGAAVSVWEAWATDETLRFDGSSGGVLTALSTWLLADGHRERAVCAVASTRDTRRTVPVSISRPADVGAAAGSRYAPVSMCASPDVLAPGTVVTAKPCEASALRSYSDETGAEPPLILSFFCAGVPSQSATDELLTMLGVDPDRLERLRYRGRGWPGEFVARDADGRSGRMSYDRSWGSVLGPSVQWRCKVCADGVGESADIAAGDYWATDERGYPSFADAPGRSALIARTARGHRTVLAAAEAGVIALRPLDVRSLYAVQPLQRDRRRTLFLRLLGARLAGRRVPDFVGFGLPRLALRTPLRSARAAAGTFVRVSRSRRSAARGRADLTTIERTT